MSTGNPALDRALAEITAMGNRPDPVRQRVAVDPRLVFLRAELQACDLNLNGMGAMNAGRAVFADFGTADYQRRCRIVKLMQVRRWQLGRADTRNDRLEYLKHAASCRLVEKRIAAASAPAKAVSLEGMAA